MKIVQFFGILLMCLLLNSFVVGNVSPGANPNQLLPPRLIYRKKFGHYKEYENPAQSARSLLHRMNLQHLHLELMRAASTPEGLLFEMKTFDQVAEILERWKSMSNYEMGKFYKNYELMQTERRFTY